MCGGRWRVDGEETVEEELVLRSTGSLDVMLSEKDGRRGRKD